MQTLTTISDYCREINIPLPRHSFFDIRSFEDNMKTIRAKQPAFRHELYAIALRNVGNNVEVNGHPLQSHIFFNSPYQVITWDIVFDWKGYYIIFDRDFVSLNPAWNNFIIDYPFFRLDNYKPFNLLEEDRLFAENIFLQIWKEYHSENADKFLLIQTFTQLLLQLTKRYFLKVEVAENNTYENRRADILLVSRFQNLIETLFTNPSVDGQVRQVTYYAEKLHVHPNYLNTIVKRISGKTASQIIQQHLLNASKSLLNQTNLSIKEIAFKMHFTQPTHFVAFYKKNLGLTPQQFRETLNR